MRESQLKKIIKEEVNIALSRKKSTVSNEHILNESKYSYVDVQHDGGNGWDFSFNNFEWHIEAPLFKARPFVRANGKIVNIGPTLRSELDMLFSDDTLEDDEFLEGLVDFAASVMEAAIYGSLSK